MSSPLGSPGAAAWRLEAEAVVADIAPHVAFAAPSSLPGDSSGTYLNITTLEGRQMTVRVSAGGFSICGDGHDSCGGTSEGDTPLSSQGGGGADGKVYETPYALLNDVSPAYTAAFSRALVDRLGQLAENGSDDEEREEERGKEQNDGGERSGEVKDGGMNSAKEDGLTNMNSSETT
ncbi:GSK3-beta interaction protein [Amphibalanus amphitrite]|uniref:GSK3-beta interaction protein n=1 Tax=Amphibalanus amphitrite TaxID=1232801 RepID=A0A6A4W557_AMPAM|nr:GSK3-beta interaction protein [Amphibalanus amphitrite]